MRQRRQRLSPTTRVPCAKAWDVCLMCGDDSHSHTDSSAAAAVIAQQMHHWRSPAAPALAGLLYPCGGRPAGRCQRIARRLQLKHGHPTGRFYSIQLLSQQQLEPQQAVKPARSTVVKVGQRWSVLVKVVQAARHWWWGM